MISPAVPPREWINKLPSIHPLDGNAAAEESGLRTDAAAPMAHKNIMLTERSQPQEAGYSVIHLYDICQRYNLMVTEQIRGCQWAGGG